LIYQETLQDVATQIATGEFDIKDYYGITEEGFESMYMVGFEMYKHKQDEEAKGVFTLLSMLVPSSTRYLSACGSAHFMMEDCLNASQFFRLALVQGDFTPKTLLRLAECSIRLAQFDLAERYLGELVRIAKDEKFTNDKEFQSHETRAGIMFAMVKEQLQKKLSDTGIKF